MVQKKHFCSFKHEEHELGRQILLGMSSYVTFYSYSYKQDRIPGPVPHFMQAEQAQKIYDEECS